MLSPDGVELAEEGEGDQGVGSADSQVALDLLQLAQTGLQLGCNVICKNTGALVRDDHGVAGKHRLINQTERADSNREKKQSDGLRETRQRGQTVPCGRYSLPPRILMIKLPWRTVQPLRSWAEVTESMVLLPMHSLGQRPAHRVQVSLHRLIKKGAGLREKKNLSVNDITAQRWQLYWNQIRDM